MSVSKFVIYLAINPRPVFFFMPWVFGLVPDVSTETPLYLWLCTWPSLARILDLYQGIPGPSKNQTLPSSNKQPSPKDQRRSNLSLINKLDALSIEHRCSIHLPIHPWVVKVASVSLWETWACIWEAWACPVEVWIELWEAWVSVGQPLNSQSQPLNSLSQPLNSLSQPLNGLKQPLNGLSQPLNGLGQPLNGLSQPLKGLSQPRTEFGDSG